MKVFIDESGNSGTQRYNNNWNFEEQPYFIYCAIAIPDQHVATVEKEFDELLISKCIKTELKSTNKGHMKLKSILLKDFINVLDKYKCKFYVEVVNKKFQISNYIVDYCVIPYYDIPLDPNAAELKIVKMIFANLLYKEISDNMLSEFLNLVNQKDQYDADDLVSYLKKLRLEIKCKYLYDNVEQTLDSVINYKQRGLKVENIYPVVDTYKGGYTKCSISPNIDSINNLISRFLKDSKEVKIVHDIQKELSPAIKKWTEIRNDMESDCNISIEFEDSKKSRIIQCSDYFAGNIRVCIEEKLKSNVRYDDTIENIINNDCNFVSTAEEQVKLFSNNYNLRILKKCIDEI
ncbi:DUF3800 domain-containing protein [Clostridium gasigenes]|uniref:DUF3800 domain-containing protein n=1 Tax=Clostridium gasigenes TaxID=94869 RepID=UPI00162A035B|nr:DUF3800 domain-containing protein [Clostridium gasigenes]MBB6624811.1 DUF3800 domain-containing protein [Clostridium gasigenes]